MLERARTDSIPANVLAYVRPSPGQSDHRDIRRSVLQHTACTTIFRDRANVQTTLFGSVTYWKKCDVSDLLACGVLSGLLNTFATKDDKFGAKFDSLKVGYSILQLVNTLTLILSFCNRSERNIYAKYAFPVQKLPDWLISFTFATIDIYIYIYIHLKFDITETHCVDVEYFLLNGLPNALSWICLQNISNPVIVLTLCNQVNIFSQADVILWNAFF